MKAISLFSSGGIGDLALKAEGIDIVVSNELINERHQIFAKNFPEAQCFSGDIWELSDQIIDFCLHHFQEPIEIVYATPPCQGMSKNGQGKLLNGIRSGKKSRFDKRNRLIIPALKIIKALQPEIVIFENVPEMQNTIIEDEQGNIVNIIDYIRSSLNNYIGSAEVVEFADYGVPQCRQRLITIFTRNQLLQEFFYSEHSFLPRRTHARFPSASLKRWVSLRDVLTGIEPLDAKTIVSAQSKNIPLHRVPILDEDKYFWVANTPPESGAFDNQCAFCGFDENPSHTSKKDADGINTTNHNDTIYCKKCARVLPRPWVKDGQRYRLMKGYTSAYRRMKWDEPASTLTRNLSYACSDKKLHPDQNRVLSLYEALLLHTVADYEYKWERADGKIVSDKLIREIIGESIPPRGLQQIIKNICDIYRGKKISNKEQQLAFI